MSGPDSRTVNRPDNRAVGLAIVGATATGKTALAMALHERLPSVELVSVDAMCVYRGMDIGTAKPSPEERRRAPWHLLDLVDPSVDFSVADFQRSARRAVAEIGQRGNIPVLVGGTGLYHRAVVDGLTLPGRWPDVASALEEEASRAGGLRLLHERLAELDPVAAARMTATNRRRIVRALEVTIGSGRPFSSFGPGLAEYRDSGFVLVGLRMERQDLWKRLEERLDAQLDAGFLEEVRRLVTPPATLSRTARQALGYRELLAHLEDGVSLESARAEALRRMRMFAKRQESWFGRDPRVHWMDSGTTDLVESVVSMIIASISRTPAVRN